MNARGAAVVTGASGGIGLEIARVLAREGYDVVLVARSAARLAAISTELEAEYKIRAVPIALDLATDEAPQALVDALTAHNVSDVEILVNNAGFATYGKFAETALKEEVEEIHLNVLTLTVLTKLMLPAMLARGRGNILNVASTAAFVPGPLMAVYYATKHFVLALSESIADELKGTGVSVTVLCPGATESGFGDRANMQDSKLFARKLPDSRSVAEFGVAAMHAKKTVVIHGAANHAIPWVARLLPRGIIPSIVRRAQAPLGHS
jgi:short-subunit dehydrogenase